MAQSKLISGRWEGYGIKNVCYKAKENEDVGCCVSERRCGLCTPSQQRVRYGTLRNPLRQSVKKLKPTS
jgi:hypothetical protein